MTTGTQQLMKICGLSTPEAVSAARAGGATHVGFIFFPRSPRNVNAQLAADLTSGLRDVETVAVTVDADDGFLDAIVSTMRPTMLQLHGRESLERVAELKARHGLPLVKALAVRDGHDLEKARTYDGAVDLLLLDAKPPKGSDLPGGNGVSFDWSLLDGLNTETPVLLSGGIDLTNVGEAMGRVRDPGNSIAGLDLSSGVESAPGVKDTAKIEAFLAVCC